MLLTIHVQAQLQFIENKGQWDRSVDFKSDIQNGAFFIQPSGFLVLQHQADDMQAFAAKMHGHEDGAVASRAVSPVEKDLKLRSHAYKVTFVGASTSATPMPDRPLSTYNNYYIGSDPKKWQSECRLFQAVTYKNMYPNIDVRYYTGQGTLKYDIIVHPGGNVNDIALRYDGADKLTIQNKELVIATSIGDTRELYPYSYQVEEKGRQTVDCKYVLDKNIVRFKLKDYDPAKTLVIDPTLIFCSFTGSTSDNWGYTATPGPDGSFFAGGIVFDSGFPTSIGAFQFSFSGGVEEDPNGPYDIAIIKLTPDGSNRVYATYLGGGGNEQPHSMICDNAGNLIVAGRTNSNAQGAGAFPVSQPLIGPGGQYDIFVTRFNASGTALLGSVRVGGASDDGVNIRSKYSQLGVNGQNDGAYDTRRNYGDDARSEVILDGAGNIYLASCTQSSDFPTVAAFFKVRLVEVERFINKTVW